MDGAIRRRRMCQNCGYRFTTHERMERRSISVVKRDGSREPFERDKIFRGLQVACRKRQITLQQMEKATERIEQRVLRRGGEIPAMNIGRFVMDELREMDLVGYLRFASVYLEVQSPSDFIKLLSPWIDAPGSEE